MKKILITALLLSAANFAIAEDENYSGSECKAYTLTEDSVYVYDAEKMYINIEDLKISADGSFYNVGNEISEKIDQLFADEYGVFVIIEDTDSKLQIKNEWYWKCPRCKTLNPKSARYCTECGIRQR